MFKVTIVNLKTGATEVDVMATAVCAGVQSVNDEEHAGVLACVDGPVDHAANAIRAAQAAASDLKKLPGVLAAVTVGEIMDDLMKED